MEKIATDLRDNQELSEKFLHLVGIMDELREKCPWDQQQTIQTLRSMTIEETYELAAAIDDQSWGDIKEELGDLLLHLLFYAKIGQEKGQFMLRDVLDGIATKMIHRHPHIYGDVVVNGEADVKKNWQKIKLKEGKSSIFSGVPAALPALVKATRIQEKARQVGFDWEVPADVFEKVEVELGELQEAVAKKDVEEASRQADIEQEYGDLLFSMINYARFLKVDPETALEKSNRKFIQRFQTMESLAGAAGENLSNLDLKGMDLYWEKAKSALKKAAAQKDSLNKSADAAESLDEPDVKE